MSRTSLAWSRHSGESEAGVKPAPSQRGSAAAPRARCPPGHSQSHAVFQPWATQEHCWSQGALQCIPHLFHDHKQPCLWSTSCQACLCLLPTRPSTKGNTTGLLSSEVTAPNKKETGITESLSACLKCAPGGRYLSGQVSLAFHSTAGIRTEPLDFKTSYIPSSSLPAITDADSIPFAYTCTHMQ